MSAFPGGWGSSRCTGLLLTLTALLIRDSPIGQQFYGPWNKVSLWGHFLFMWYNQISKHLEQHRILIQGPNSWCLDLVDQMLKSVNRPSISLTSCCYSHKEVFLLCSDRVLNICLSAQCINCTAHWCITSFLKKIKPGDTWQSQWNFREVSDTVRCYDATAAGKTTCMFNDSL